MDFPPRGMEIINQLYQQHRDLASGSEDQQRQLTLMIGEQLSFELGSQWGVKSAGPGHPQGSSTVAFSGPPLLIWRWSDGDGHVTGTMGAPLPQPLMEPPNQTAGQIFIPCSPIDHLSVPVDPAPVEVQPAQPPSGDDVAHKLDVLIARFESLTAAIDQLTAKMTDLRQNGVKLKF